MDNEDISHLLSPSKARQDAARAKDWSFVTSWLTRLYPHPTPMPRFERNDDTLQALLSLIATNAAADERANFLQRAQKEELELLLPTSSADDGDPKNAKTNLNQQFIDRLVDSLERAIDPTTSNALDEIAEASLHLGSLSTDPETMGEDIVDLTTEAFFIEDHIQRIEQLRQQLEKETVRLQSEVDRLTAEKAENDLEAQQQQIADWNRASKMLGIKFEEYREKVVALERTENEGLTIEDLQEREHHVMRQKDQLRMLERELHGYHHLPPDLDAMKAEYQRLSAEVDRLQRRRDEMFESMANR